MRSGGRKRGAAAEQEEGWMEGYGVREGCEPGVGREQSHGYGRALRRGVGVRARAWVCAREGCVSVTFSVYASVPTSSTALFVFQQRDSQVAAGVASCAGAFACDTNLGIIPKYGYSDAADDDADAARAFDQDDAPTISAKDRAHFRCAARVVDELRPSLRVPSVVATASSVSANSARFGASSESTSAGTTSASVWASLWRAFARSV